MKIHSFKLILESKIKNTGHGPSDRPLATPLISDVQIYKYYI